MRNTQTAREVHNLRLKINVVAKLWVKWNKREINGDELATRICQALPKEVDRAWVKEIGRINTERYGTKPVKCLEDLLV